MCRQRGAARRQSTSFLFPALLYPALCWVRAALHYCTLAASTVFVLFAVVVAVRVVVVAGPAAARVGRHVSVVFPDLTHNVVKGVVDVDAGPGGCLDELAATEATCERGTLCLRLA